MKKEKILLVEDEAGIRGLIQLYLEKCGYDVVDVDNGEKAVQLLNDQYQLVLLDIEMPKMNGFQLCEIIREKQSVPIIFISSRRSIEDKVKSFEIGGDDYITKPFNFVELEARVKANIRRFYKINNENENRIKYRTLEILLDRYECYLDDQLIHLSTKEMEILITLAKRPNQVWSNEQLYNHIWEYGSGGDVQTVKVHISNLRRKLANNIDCFTYIETIRGLGYKFTY